MPVPVDILIRVEDEIAKLRGIVDQTALLTAHAAEMAKHQEAASAHAHSFVETMKLGVGIGIGEHIVEKLREIPHLLREAVMEGIEFNEQLNEAADGAAAVLRQFKPAEFENFGTALGASRAAIESLQEKAMDTPAAFHSLLSAFKSTDALAVKANISMREYVDLLIVMSRGMKALNVPETEISGEIRALLSGRRVEYSQIGRMLGVTSQEVKEWKESGTLVEELRGRFSRLSEAAESDMQQFGTLKVKISDVFNAIRGAMSERILETFEEGLGEIYKVVRQPEFAERFRQIGDAVTRIVVTGSHVSGFLIEHAQLFIDLAKAIALATVAVVAFQLASTLTTQMVLAQVGTMILAYSRLRTAILLALFENPAAGYLAAFAALAAVTAYWSTKVVADVERQAETIKKLRQTITELREEVVAVSNAEEQHAVRMALIAEMHKANAAQQQAIVDKSQADYDFATVQLELVMRLIRQVDALTAADMGAAAAKKAKVAEMTQEREALAKNLDLIEKTIERDDERRAKEEVERGNAGYFQGRVNDKEDQLHEMEMRLRELQDNPEADFLDAGSKPKQEDAAATEAYNHRVKLITDYYKLQTQLQKDQNDLKEAEAKMAEQMLKNAKEGKDINEALVKAWSQEAEAKQKVAEADLAMKRAQLELDPLEQQAQINGAYDQQIEAQHALAAATQYRLKEAILSEEERNALLNQQEEIELKIAETEKARRQFNEKADLQAIDHQMMIVNGMQKRVELEDSLTPQAKQNQTVDLAKQENELLERRLQLLQQLIASDAVGSEDYDRHYKMILQDQEKYLQNQKQISKATFGGEITAGLRAWANSFGTVANQVSNIITNQLTTGIQGFANALAQALVTGKNLGEALGQLFEQMAIQFVASVIQMILIATVAIPILTALGILSGGSIPAQGAVMTSAALGMGASMAAQYRAQGGEIYGSGGPMDDNVIVMASPGEHMVNARAAQYYGHELFDRFNKLEMPRPGRGANFSPAALYGMKPGVPNVNVAASTPTVLVLDSAEQVKRWQKEHGEAFVVTTVHRNRGQLGLPA